MPPKYSMISTSVDFRMSNMRGLMNCNRCAYNPPATPAKKADTRKAEIFTRRVWTPQRSQTISSSRIAAMPRPYFEYTRLRKIQIVMTTQTYTHGSVVSCSMPMKPRGPPTTSRFSNTDLTIMLKASVTIAR
ncbi:MAG: hypothetical protein A2X46_00650 [Lentisphaerae bacterium GWF2_57_35]|nr:MAG: hypothetical protein A2X46_00650 [Lentisphaerae bacterium GWF2_57_35]